MTNNPMQRQLRLLIFVCPAMGLFLIFMAYPLFRIVFLSFHRWSGFVGSPMPFVGLSNYVRMLHDDVFAIAFRNTIKFSVSTTVAWSVFGLSLAILLSAKPKGMNLYRTFFFLPVMFGIIVVGLTWRMIYQPENGLLNLSLRFVGLSNLARRWLQEPGLVMWSLAHAYVWQFTGYSMVIYLAGLQTVPHELYESAMIDGASKIRMVRSITLPLMIPFVRIVVSLNIIGSMKVFALVRSTTGGGPMNASQVLATYMYDHAFEYGNVGYASSIATVFTIVVTFLVFGSRQLTRGAR